MNLEGIVEHMNNDHSHALLRLAQKYGNKNAQSATMTHVDASGIEINYDGTKLHLSFPMTLSSRGDVIAAIIALCQDSAANGKNDGQSIATEIAEFQNSLGSIIIASVDSKGNAVCSTAPLIRYHGNHYIYISEIAEHYASIAANPDKLQILFVEDEAKVQTLLARKRITYRAHAEFVQRGCAEFESALDSFEHSKKTSGAKVARQMSDFHLVRLVFTSGRFVKGFGQAYDIDTEGNVVHVGGDVMPHKSS